MEAFWLSRVGHVLAGSADPSNWVWGGRCGTAGLDGIWGSSEDHDYNRSRVVG